MRIAIQLGNRQAPFAVDFNEYKTSMSQSIHTSKKTLPLLIAGAVVVALLAVTIVMRQRAVSRPADANGLSAVAQPVSTGLDPGNAPPDAAGLARTRSTLSRQDIARQVRAVTERHREARANAREKSDALQKKVAAQFSTEKVDAAWAPGKETSLESIASLPEITSGIPAPSTMQVACRSSMCRIESSFKSSGNADDWTMAYMSSVGNALPNAVVARVQNPDGTTSVRIYGKAR